jgi:peptide/nickel transport system substrate-binding protein
MTHPFRQLAPVATSMFLLLAACGGTAAPASSPTGSAAPAAKAPASAAKPAASAAAGSQWTVAITEEPTRFDPGTADASNGTNEAMRHVFDALVTYEGTPFKLTPMLAESWTVTDNNWDFKLRDVKFSNGDPLTADDFVYSFKLYSDAKSPFKIYTDGVTDVQAVDPHTLRLTTSGPRPSLMANLSQLYVMDKAARDKAGPDGYAQHPIGTGPYTLTEFTRGSRVVLDANPNYWRGSVEPKKLIWRLIADPATRVAELKSGGIQIAAAPPLPQLAELQTGNTEVLSLKGSRTILYPFNTTQKPFSDVRVRQAINYAVDRQSILKDILDGQGELLHGPWASSWMGYDSSLQPYPYDVNKAKQLLADAGYSGGFETEWDISSGVFPKDREIAEAVASELGQVGIKPRLVPTERAKLQSDWLAGTFTGMISEAWGATADPDAMLAWALYKRKGFAPDAKLDDLIDQSRAASDPQQRAKIMQDLGHYVNDQADWLFIHAQDEFYAKSKNVNWKPVPQGQSFANVLYYTLTPKS